MTQNYGEAKQNTMGNRLNGKVTPSQKQTPSKTRVLHTRENRDYKYKTHHRLKERPCERGSSGGCKEVEEAFHKSIDLIPPKLAFTIHTVNKADWHLANGETKLSRPDHHFHLEDVAFGHCCSYQPLQNLFSVQSEAACEVRDAGSQEKLCHKIGSSRYYLPFQVPSIDSTIASIASASDNIKVAFLLLQDELRDELWVVAQVGVHDDDVVARGVLDPMHIGCAQSKFLCSWSQYYPLNSVDLFKLLSRLQGPVWAAIVDHNDLKVKASFGEGLDEQPDNDWEVFLLIVGWQQHTVLVTGHLSCRSESSNK